ncbi:MAG TPA: lipopolysaccharide heptosyltransferase II, partial [Thermoanaerobaculia bacterium]|nr:lipopolysaccharide heptosyltransferase II [Thermoanaerobaculia bacterium]
KGRKQTMAAAEKILIRAPNWLGDAVMAIPAMAAVRRAYRDRALTLAAAPSIAPLFHEITPVAPDQILTVDKTTETATLRAAGAGRAILFPNSFRTAWGSRQAGIRERWGYGTHGRSLILTRAVRRPRHTVHQAEYYLHLVRELGIETPEGPPLARIEISEPTRRRVLELLEQHRLDTSAPLVGIAPGAAYGHAKRWPPERAAELAGRLTARGASIVLVGAAGDRGAGREIESSVPAGVRIVNLIGRTDLRLFAGLLAACHAFVSNDSGAMHLAAAAGVPVVAIFGPTDERVTAPLGDHDVIIHQVFCRPCMLRDCPIDHRCMRGIGVDVVFDAVCRRLDRRARPAEDPGA